MTRKQLIENYNQCHGKLRDALDKIPKEAWQFKPSPEEWSIHEIIQHLPDSEISGSLRLRKIIAEPKTEASLYDQVKWAENLPYHKMSTDLALDLFDCMRKQNIELLNLIEYAKWENEITHQEFGVMSIHKWVEVYTVHIIGHIGQMQRNYKKWQEK